MPGDWMSVSTTPTRLPWRATAATRFAVRFDLPVPPRNEWTEMIFPTPRYSSLVPFAVRARRGRPNGLGHGIDLAVALADLPGHLLEFLEEGRGGDPFHLLGLRFLNARGER